MWRQSIIGTVICCLTAVTAVKSGGQNSCSYFRGDKLWPIHLLNYVYICKILIIYSAPSFISVRNMRQRGRKRKRTGKRRFWNNYTNAHKNPCQGGLKMFRSLFETQQQEKFYVLLTAHLGIILFNDQLDAQFFSVCVYLNSLHVSSIQVLIIRRFNCINTISGICHSM